MKKKVSLFLAVLFVLGACVSFATAETPDTILFRNIPWLSKEADVVSYLAQQGIKAYWSRDNYSIPDWFQTWSNINGDYTVDNGGCYISFDDVVVAGYKADLDTYYLYPIIDGKVWRQREDAQFYLAQYEISGLTDMDAVYNDLVEKLNSIYGANKPKNSDSSWTDTTGVLWTANDDSKVWLARYVAYGSTKVKIWYAAPHSTERLQQLENQILRETIEAEEQERESNKSNTDGL